MTTTLKNEILNLIKLEKLNCTINKFQNKVDWDYISMYQKLSKSFIKKHNLIIPKDSWMYKSDKEKLDYIKLNDCPYEVVDDKYIIAYKSTKINGYSVYNFQYKYEVGKSYSSTCDCITYNKFSFGLSAWTKEKALQYYDRGDLYKVKINLEDIGVIINDYKIRARKITILEKIKF